MRYLPLKPWATLARRLLSRNLAPSGSIDKSRLHQIARRSKKSEVDLRPPSTIAVVIPCYQHAEFLSQCFESVLDQTRPPDQVIVVIDNSADASLEISESFIPHFRRQSVRMSILNNSRNLGQAASINRGVEKANTDLVMVLNDDDLLFPDAIEVGMGVLRSRSEVGLLGASCIPFDGATDPMQLRKRSGSGASRSPEVSIRQKYAVLDYEDVNAFNITHSGMIFAKSAWKAARGYQPVISKRIVKFSDRDFQFRMNCFVPVASLDDSFPLALWRKGYSVDKGRNS